MFYTNSVRVSEALFTEPLERLQHKERRSSDYTSHFLPIHMDSWWVMWRRTFDYQLSYTMLILGGGGRSENLEWSYDDLISAGKVHPSIYSLPLAWGHMGAFWESPSIELAHVPIRGQTSLSGCPCCVFQLDPQTVQSKNWHMDVIEMNGVRPDTVTTCNLHVI